MSISGKPKDMSSKHNSASLIIRGAKIYSTLLYFVNAVTYLTSFISTTSVKSFETTPNLCF